MFALRRFFQSATPIPVEHRKNFMHFYMDIGWWGLLNGSVLVFLGIYASRLGASTFQIGLLTASPALVNMLFTFPSGSLLGRMSSVSATRWSAVFMRIFYALLIPLPVLLRAQTQIWVIIAITLLMNIPGTMIAISFNAFFAENVPPEYRAQVAATRNALFALFTMLTSLTCGFVLTHTSFNTGYQVVFAIGFAGAVLSSVNIFLVKPVADPPGVLLPSPELQKEIAAAEKAPLHASRMESLRLDIVRGPFGKILLLVFALQLSIFVISPVVPIYQVNVLKQTDAVISLGNTVFYLVYFLGSIQTRRMANRHGFQRLTGMGIGVISIALIVFAYAYQPWIYMIHLSMAGMGWALLNAGQVNFILERVPVNERAPYLTWYNIANNAALLVCGLLGPSVAGLIGLFGTLMLTVGLRALVAVGFYRKL